MDRNAEPRRRGYTNHKEWFQKEPKQAWDSARPILRDVHSTGWFSCLAEGFRVLYNVDLMRIVDSDSQNVEPILQLDGAVQRRYRKLTQWYKEAYELTGIEYILRPTQLEFGFQIENPKERELMAPLLRIDQFCEFYINRTGAMEYCVEKTGVDPTNADEFREFLAKVFQAADEAGFVGTKQLQAYRRPLDFIRPKDSEVCFEPAKDRGKRLTFGNFVMYECAQLAAERDWPHQIHTGTHNLPDSNPLPLRPLIKAFPRVKFVLIHCWPFQKESAFLAKSYANVFIDTCWTPVLNLAYFKESLETYIGYLPDTKMTIGHDSTSVEMAAGSLSHCRAIAARVLQERIDDRQLTYEGALSLAKCYFADSARALYKISI